MQIIDILKAEITTEKKKYVFFTDTTDLELAIIDMGYSAICVNEHTPLSSTLDIIRDNLNSGIQTAKRCFIGLLQKSDNDILSTFCEQNYIKCEKDGYLIFRGKEHIKSDIVANYDEARALIDEFIAKRDPDVMFETVKEYSAVEILDHFKNIENEALGYEVSTGFSMLDKLLGGGLHEGLIVVGAISSLGKTTFTLQLADQVAQSGNDVLFFSLEMSKHEIIAKSLSRYTFKAAQHRKTAQGEYIAKDTAQLLNGRRYKYYSEVEKQAINSAIDSYEKTAAPHLFIYEGRYMGERITVKHIREIVKSHIIRTGRTPVVIVDYLQILAPLDIRQTDRQATDEAVFCLKEISRDYKLPVIAISSFNRENYSNPVSMQSFKESGAIEYSSDILLALQYAGMDFIPGEKEKERGERLQVLHGEVYRRKREKEPISIELKCLKNRNGYQFTVNYDLVSAFNSFVEAEPNKDGFIPYEGKSPFDDIKKQIPIV